MVLVLGMAPLLAICAEPVSGGNAPLLMKGKHELYQRVLSVGHGVGETIERRATPAIHPQRIRGDVLAERDLLEAEGPLETITHRPPPAPAATDPRWDRRAALGAALRPREPACGGCWRRRRTARIALDDPGRTPAAVDGSIHR